MRLPVRRTCLRWVAPLLTLAFGALQGLSQGFEPGCTLPFKDLAEKRPIDSSCSADGGGTTQAKIAESRNKNNFCASGPPVRITLNTLKRLQNAAEHKAIPFGASSSLPADRSVLNDLIKMPDGAKVGEGTLVRLAAFLNDAHFSNVSNGEAVNCKLKGKENNDIHIALTTGLDEDDLCNSVTAEITPHFRPESWIEIIDLNLRRPIRITGQLFFDASHRPCTATKRASPPRASIWEIHPVYALHVCKNKTLASCRADNESVWIPLNDWLSSDEGNENH